MGESRGCGAGVVATVSGVCGVDGQPVLELGVPKALRRPPGPVLPETHPKHVTWSSLMLKILV